VNEVSEALYRLLNGELITRECVVEIINHIREAFSCNEKPEVFMEREDKTLCQLFEKITEYRDK